MGLGVCEAQAGPSRREGARVVSRTATRGRAESTRIMSLVASAGRTPRVRGRDIEWRRDRENRDRARVGGTYGTRNNKRVSPSDLPCAPHAAGRADRRIRERTAKQYKKVRHPAAPSDTPWSCFTFFTQFSPLTKEVSVSFRVSHNATSVFASVRRDVLVRSYSVGVVAIEYRTVLRA
jgi:hypothetical protein